MTLVFIGAITDSPKTVEKYRAPKRILLLTFVETDMTAAA